MNPAKYPSKERVERDGVLVHAEGDDLINDLDEAKRQGYKIDSASTEDDSAGEAPVKRSPRRKSTAKKS